MPVPETFLGFVETKGNASWSGGVKRIQNGFVPRKSPPHPPRHQGAAADAPFQLPPVSIPPPRSWGGPGTPPSRRGGGGSGHRPPAPFLQSRASSRLRGGGGALASRVA